MTTVSLQAPAATDAAPRRAGWISPIYLRAELLRRRRSARLLVFTLGIPALLFFANSGDKGTSGGLDLVPYFMVDGIAEPNAQ